MCCRHRQKQRFLNTEPLPQTQRLSSCAVRRQQRRELKALAIDSRDLAHPSATQVSHWTEYQPRTMAGILVMGIALGLQEGGKKIKEKRDERKAKKAALVAEAYAPAGSSSSGVAREARTTHRVSQREDKIEEARREQQRRSLSSERGLELERDAPPSYDEIPRPTYEEAMQTDQRRR